MAEVLSRLTGPARAVLQFTDVTGWRIPSEVLALEWRQGDFDAQKVRIDPGVPKGGEGRVFPLTPDLDALLRAQKRQHDALKQHGVICPWVFQRNGHRITSIIKAFKASCIAAGYPGVSPTISGVQRYAT
jgi:integrase